jgi:DNA-binding transcriptional LysR family regulator
MSLDVRRMRHVLALADHGSFARAAAALGLSQPALSRSIQSVEKEVGGRLFVRTPNGIEATDSGHALVARLRQIVQLTEELDQDLASDRSQQSGHVHVGAGPYPAHSMVPEALARFVTSYPRVVVRVMMREFDELLRHLRAREIEFFVAETSTFERESDLAIEPFEQHPMFILGRRGHPLAGRTPVAFGDGLAFPYVAVSRIPPRVFEPIRAARRRLPDSRPGHQAFPALELNSIDAAKRVVLRSDALMVAPPACVEDELESGTLVALGSEPYLRLDYGIVRLRSHPPTMAGARFRTYMLEAELLLAARDQELFERYQPRPAPPPLPGSRTATPARGRRRPGSAA